MPKAMYRLGIDDDAGRADLTLVADPAAIGDHARCADTRLEHGTQRGQLLEAPLVVEPGTAGDDALRLREVDRCRVGWQNRFDRRVVALGEHRDQRADHGGRVEAIHSADPGLQGCHERVRRFDRMQLGAVSTDEIDPDRRDAEGLRVQRSAKLGGQPGSQVAAVGRRRHDQDRLVGKLRCQHLRPRARAKLADLHHRDFAGHMVEVGRGGRRARSDEYGPAIALGD